MNPARKAVKIIATSAMCGSGLNKKQIFDNCAKGISSVNSSGLAPITIDAWEKLKASTPTEMNQSHCSIMAFHCFNEALAESGWSNSELADCGFLFATTTSQIDQWEQFLSAYHAKHLTAEKIRKAASYQSLGRTLVDMQNYFGISGPSSVLSSSCSASLQALALGAMWIRTGRVKRCIVGTTEILCDLTTTGFNSLRLLSKEICQPFDQNRKGINLGEASAFLFLEADDVSQRPAQGYIAGVGFSSDAFSATSPHPTGAGSEIAIEMALDDAQMIAKDIQWVYAHGTGSPANDSAEASALKKVFSSSPSKPAVSSTKSIHGHTLAACGALESVLALLALKHNLILPNFNLAAQDTQIDLDIVATARETPITSVLKNSLGFGGINCSVVLSKNPGGNL